MSTVKLEEYADFVFFSALNKCGNIEDAHDITQETFLSALVFLSKGGVAENMEAWLKTVMTRKYYDKLRKKYRQPSVYIDDITETLLMSETDISENIIKSEEAENIRREVSYLSELYRKVVVMHYMESKSIERISNELCIPEGTVKSRLSKGREKIKKGIETMEKYSDLSYAPKGLYITHSGGPAMNGEPRTLVNDDLLAQNILIAAYDEPLTEEEIAKKIGVPTAYVEEKIHKLFEGELMQKIGNKFYTDFIIYNPEEQFKYIPAQKKFVEENIDILWNPIKAGLEKIRNLDAYKKLSERQQYILDFHFIMKCYDYANTSKNVYGYQVFKPRPNGGCWIAFGYIKTELADKPENQGYGYSGERHNDFYNYLDTKTIWLHIYSTQFFEYNIPMKYPMSEGSLTQLLYILSQKKDLAESGFNTVYLENIPDLITHGLIKKDGDDLTVEVPVLDKKDYDAIQVIMNESMIELENSATDIYTEYLKGKAVKLPKHLTSVPDQKLYWRARCFTSMMTVYRAMELGYFRKPAENETLPAMALVIDRG